MTRKAPAEFALDDWGLGGIFSESGRLERPVTPNLLLVPGSIEIEGERLVWTHELIQEKRLAAVLTGASPERYRKLFDELGTKASWDCYVSGGREETVLIRRIATHPAKIVLPGSNILEQFVRLADGSTDAIRDYALKWGVLGICKHGLPRTHNFRRLGPPRFCMPTGYRSIDDFGTCTAWEPLSAWRHYSRLAQGILDIASRLHQGESVDDEDLWKQAGIEFMGYDDADKRTRRIFQQFTISVEVNGWLELAGVRPFFSWGEGEEATVALGTTTLGFSTAMQKEWLPKLSHLHGTTLFGALGIQILMAVSRKEGFAICSACGMPYAPKRRPNPKRRRYCHRCGLPAAWRNAQQERRARLRTSQ